MIFGRKGKLKPEEFQKMDRAMYPFTWIIGLYVLLYLQHPLTKESLAVSLSTFYFVLGLLSIYFFIRGIIIYRFRHSSIYSYYFYFLTDLSFITWGVYSSGGINSPFHLLYYVELVAATVSFGMARSLTLIFFLVTLFYCFGSIPNIVETHYWYGLLNGIFFFTVITLMGGYTTEVWWEMKKRLASFEERSRLVAEIHDGSAQDLTNIILRMELCKRLLEKKRASALLELDEIIEASRKGLKKLRETIFNLKEGVPFGSLPFNLQKLAEDFRGEKIKIDLEVRGKESDLPAEVKEKLFLIAREGIANSIKHAKASHLWVRLKQDNELELIISDDGVGFDLEEVETNSKMTGHLGLTLMKERTKKIGASLLIETALGQGTKVIVRWTR